MLFLSSHTQCCLLQDSLPTHGRQAVLQRFQPLLRTWQEEVAQLLDNMLNAPDAAIPRRREPHTRHTPNAMERTFDRGASQFFNTTVTGNSSEPRGSGQTGLKS